VRVEGVERVERLPRYVIQVSPSEGESMDDYPSTIYIVREVREVREVRQNADDSEIDERLRRY
jgi:hypothetical protein